MTNRQAFMCKLIQMSDEEFANLFKTEIVDYIYAAKCDDCKKENSGQCRIETEQLDGCPIDLIDWLRKQAN
jgi:hypothetical protein